MPPVKFTVAICTWNRASLLFRTLEHLTHIRHPDAAWELLVVNNNCTDETERILDRFNDRLPLRRMFEPAPGLSHARNTAVKNATGDYIVWTDDDVLVDPGWLVAYQRAVERWPEAAVFGGPVRPKFEDTPPRWLSAVLKDVEQAFATRELGREPFELEGRDRDKVPFGPNFVIRTREQKQFPYNPILGRIGSAGTLGEETEVIRAILASGCTGWWVPDAVVEHWIPKNRQTIRYLQSYYALLGKTYYRLDTHDAPMFWGRPRWLWRKTIHAEIKYVLSRLKRDQNRWPKLLIQSSILRGAISKRQ